MNYIVAVSGGVDSVVLLDLLSRSEHRLVVAHVDHGIRKESGDDAAFVEALAKQYGLGFIKTQLALGPHASEEQARTGRYDFLYEAAKTYKADIATAHHRDDMIGSIAINCLRGTGWRGLAVMNRAHIVRPLVSWPKKKIYDYALAHRLEWVEDATNRDAKYLRNTLRASILQLEPDSTNAVVQLRQRQLQLAHDIDREVSRLEVRFGDRRHPYTVIAGDVAIELLRRHVEVAAAYRPSIDQAERLLLAIKTTKPNTRVDIAHGIYARFHGDTFVVETS